ncbi:acyl-CoA thioesterase II [Phycicoccus sp. Root101]|uniref:acyl-CoA thioesterase n=1 Tax=Phycicoccus sp. Root101 TaxID=1736421 RepID=UPI000AFCB63E|nr:acyl-CoA thioesterase domain-containing protein [Phycicoccus sp. Root101]
MTTAGPVGSEPDPAPTSEILTRALELVPVAAQHFDAAYTATTQPCPWPKAYGGDMVAQAAAAAMLTVTDGKTMHSMHSYFMRPVDIGAPVTYEVEVLRDGRGYATRQVRAFQNGKAAYTCLASFAAGEHGGSYAAQPAPGVPAPDTLPSTAAYLADRAPGGDSTMTEESKAYWSGGRSFDMRHVPGPVYLEVDGGSTPHQALWVKPFDALRPVEGLTDAQRDLAALAYVCDYTILEPVLRVLGLPWAQPGLVTASLDHAMWFHRAPGPGVLDGWLLYAQEAVAADSGRGVGLGRFFTPDGEHLATVVQEGMIRATPGGH